MFAGLGAWRTSTQTSLDCSPPPRIMPSIPPTIQETYRDPMKGTNDRRLLIDPAGPHWFAVVVLPSQAFPLLMTLGSGGTPYNGLYTRGGSALSGYLFQASGQYERVRKSVT